MNCYQSPYLVRLQDLKVWQGSYDSMLQNKSKESSHASDYETIEGISALDTSNPSVEHPLENIDWDKKTISPTKTFAQLLEEKLAEDKPIEVQAKPKKPFLRKGAGLLRYKLGPKAVPAKQPQTLAKKSSGFKTSNQISTPHHKDCLKKTVDANTEPEVCMIPLKMPDISIKPKATWSKITENLENHHDNNVKITENKDLVAPQHLDKHPNIMGRINEFAFKHFLHNNHENIRREFVNKDNGTNAVDLNKGNMTAQTSFENTMRDLKIFETLEERVEHPSFSSTNSSIIKMLASTPRKMKAALESSPIIEENQVAGNVKGNSDIGSKQKMTEANRKSDMLHEFLNNLRKIADNDHTKPWTCESRQIVDENYRESTDTSYTESTNTDTRSQSPSSFYTDFENTLRDSHCRKIDAAVNTSIIESENDKKAEDKCQNCEMLRKSLDKIKEEIPDVQREKAKICDFAKDLEKKRDQLTMEIQKLRDKYDRDVTDLREELVAEKKKFSKEKALFDMYIKESQNRPTKKERDEIATLKKDLTDTKELLKMKEAKNGATQARLRNQVKQLEKEKMELKNAFENLQKENAKLIAAQKVRRPSEVKMLHEINRNLTKLTEETFKKQVTKSDISNNLKGDENFERNDRRLSNDKELSPKQKKSSISKRSYSADVPSNDIIEHTANLTNFANLSLEKEYENVFNNSPKAEMQISSLNDSKKGKTETLFPDGSKQIKYSNGNSKTISPDGKLIVVQYYNGDIKETNINENTLKYYYAENDTWQTQFEDGSELLQYPNGQKERKLKDGTKEVTCPDGSIFIKFPDGTEEVQYPDGSKMMKTIDGDKILLLPNGQKEVHTKDHKRREYPDGTVKILYPDGTQETRYASGRIRIKDVNGALLLDSQS